MLQPVSAMPLAMPPPQIPGAVTAGVGAIAAAAAAYNATRMDANADFLESYVKPNGGGFTVGRIVMPGHRNTNDGAIPFTYIIGASDSIRTQIIKCRVPIIIIINSIISHFINHGII